MSGGREEGRRGTSIPTQHPHTAGPQAQDRRHPPHPRHWVPACFLVERPGSRVLVQLPVASMQVRLCFLFLSLPLQGPPSPLPCPQLSAELDVGTRYCSGVDRPPPPQTPDVPGMTCSSAPLWSAGLRGCSFILAFTGSNPLISALGDWLSWLTLSCPGLSPFLAPPTSFGLCLLPLVPNSPGSTLELCSKLRKDFYF